MKRNDNSPPKKSGIPSLLISEQRKLDKLDGDEMLLNSSLSKGEISDEEYHRLINYINNEREKLITRLERKGYFNDPEDENQKTNNSFINGFINFLWEFIKISWAIFIFFATGTLQLMILFFRLMAALMK